MFSCDNNIAKPMITVKIAGHVAFPNLYASHPFANEAFGRNVLLNILPFAFLLFCHVCKDNAFSAISEQVRLYFGKMNAFRIAILVIISIFY